MDYEKLWENLAEKLKSNEDARYYAADILDMMGNAELYEKAQKDCMESYVEIQEHMPKGE